MNDQPVPNVSCGYLTIFVTLSFVNRQWVMTSSPIPWSSDSQRNNSHHEAFVPVNSGPIPLAAILSLVIIAYIILVFIGECSLIGCLFYFDYECPFALFIVSIQPGYFEITFGNHSMDGGWWNWNLSTGTALILVIFRSLKILFKINTDCFLNNVFSHIKKLFWRLCHSFSIEIF